MNGHGRPNFAGSEVDRNIRSSQDQHAVVGFTNSTGKCYVLAVTQVSIKRKVLKALALAILPWLLIGMLLAMPSDLAASCVAKRNKNAPSNFEVARRQVAQEPNDGVHFRINWGGGSARTWRGTIKSRQGVIKNVRPLSNTADAAATAVLSQNEIQIAHWSPTSYGGADFHLFGGLDSTIEIQLSSREKPGVSINEQYTVRELLADPVIAKTIDGEGNRYSIERPGYDRIRFEFDRPHLVFETGEKFRFQWRPFLSEAANRKQVGTWRLRSVATGRILSTKSVDFEVDALGSAVPQQVEMRMPVTEGVYHFEFSIDGRRFENVFGAFGSKQANQGMLERTVEFVVLDRQSKLAENEQASENWRVIQRLSGSIEFQKTRSVWPRPGDVDSLGNDARSVASVNGQSFLKLAPGGWQAMPLEFPLKRNSRVTKPFLVEVDYVVSSPMSLGVSLLEKDETGRYPNTGVDTGAYLPASPVRQVNANETKTLRFTVWPNDTNPYLMLTNRDSKNEVLVGDVRVLEGPDQLPVSDVAPSMLRRRQVFKWIESPHFAAAVGARGGVDPRTSETLDDWTMFYHAADRLVQQLKHDGYTGAYFPVAARGGSYYPSEHLAASPFFDSGIYFSDGRDPVQKDVFEMLARMFAREGLSLVPMFSFDTPLPAVEAALARSQTEVPGVGLIDFNQTRRQRSILKSLPIYNPLGRSVQYAVSQVIEEFAQRYQSHSVIQGVGLVCRPDTVTLLPGRRWGYDAMTVGRFSQATPEIGILVDAKESIQKDWQATQRSLLDQHQDKWLHWRADQMFRWYQEMADSIKTTRSDLRLFLAPTDLFRNEQFAAALSPSLHRSVDFQKLMLQMGFNLNSFRHLPETDSIPDVVLLRSHRIAPDASPAEERVNHYLATSNQVDQFYSRLNYASDLFQHRHALAQFAQLKSSPPFSKQPDPILRWQPAMPAGNESRQRFVTMIRRRDSRQLIDGGERFSASIDAKLRQMISIYRQLPDQSFQDVRVKWIGDQSMLPLAIRQLVANDGTYFYLANASPWPIEVKLSISDRAGSNVGNVTSMSTKPIEFAPLAPTQPQATRVDLAGVVKLAPYELVGGKSVNAGWTITDFELTLPANSDKDLRRQVFELQAKLVAAQTAPAVEVLDNPRFEVEPHSPLSGWQIGQQEVQQFEIKTSMTGSVFRDDRRYLHMQNNKNSPLWIRSNEFLVPRTGRLSISVWLRTFNAQKQPALRISAEGQTDGGNYYRFGSIGALSPDQSNQVETEWKRFAVHFDDVPVADLNRMRIGFDLMEPGSVQITDVQVFDHWLDENDAKAITQLLASTDAMLLRPEMFDRCRRLLENYWAVFLDHYVPEKNAKSNTVNATTPDAATILGPAKPDARGRESRRFSIRPTKNKVPMFRRLQDLGSRR